MPATSQSIWQVPAYLPYLQPPLTSAAVAAAEDKIGHRLPSAYVDLLRVQNGGYIAYTLPKSVHNCIAGIGPVFPSLTGRRFNYSRGLVPIDGDGHWFLCLDYREKSSEPAMTFVDEGRIKKSFAPSFSHYLALLKRKVDNVFVLEELPGPQPVVQVLTKSLRARFFEPSDFDHGYIQYRGQVGKGSSPQWVWLSPNLAPRGFARPTERRYEEIKNLLPGTALRFPELPRDAWLISATEEISAEVMDVLSDYGPRPLRIYLGADEQ